MENKKISDLVISRLPLYLRCLNRLRFENRYVTSSQEIGEKLGITPAQIRKDLSQFGEYGKQGTGYEIEFLIENLKVILNMDKVWDVAVIGIGDIGHALAHYDGFAEQGFKIAQLYDRNPKKIGEKLIGIEIEDVKNLLKGIINSNIKVVMLAVPASAAQSLTDVLVEAGVKSILNYAPTMLNAPPDVHIQYIDPIVHLQTMTFYLDKYK